MPLLRRKPRMPAARATPRIRVAGQRRKRPMPYGVIKPGMARPGEIDIRTRARLGKAGIMKPDWARSGWSKIPLIGGLIDLIMNLVFRQSFRQYKRPPLASNLRNLVQVRIDMAKKSRRPRYLRMREKTPVTAVKGHQYARRGKLHGVPKYPERKAA